MANVHCTIRQLMSWWGGCSAWVSMWNAFRVTRVAPADQGHLRRTSRTPLAIKRGGGGVAVYRRLDKFGPSVPHPSPPPWWCHSFEEGARRRRSIVCVAFKHLAPLFIKNSTSQGGIFGPQSNADLCTPPAVAMVHLCRGKSEPLPSRQVGGPI